MLTHVTFTGWDDRTDLIDLADFSRDQRPGTVEIAVLLSTSRMGEDRYPGLENAESILRVAKAHGQRTAVHVCGQASRESLIHSSLPATFRGPVPLADRVQINVPETLWDDARPRYCFANYLAAALCKPVIVQTRDPAAWPERVDGVQFLFDRSAGRGQLAERVPPLTTFQVGYAGGLGPDSVDAFVRRLAYSQGGALQHHHRAAPIWIDMESGIRESMSGFPGGPRPLPGTRDDPATVQPTFVSVTKCRQVMDAVRWALMPE
jgi:hypothetical protein